MRVLTDTDVARFPVSEAVEAMRAALLLHAQGQLNAPPRLHAGGLTFTVGATPQVFGFRAYHTRDTPHDDQLVAVWNASGQLEGVVAGSALGPLRTSALGAVAADVLARPDASRLGLIGSGVQARAHALAVACVRPLSQVLIFSRDEKNREHLAAELREGGLSARAARNAEQVCAESDLLTLATSSAVPVIQSDWVRPGTHICTLGPKEKERHEFSARAGCPSRLHRHRQPGATQRISRRASAGRGRSAAAGRVPARTAATPTERHYSLFVGGAGGHGSAAGA